MGGGGQPPNPPLGAEPHAERETHSHGPTASRARASHRPFPRGRTRAGSGSGAHALVLLATSQGRGWLLLGRRTARHRPVARRKWLLLPGAVIFRARLAQHGRPAAGGFGAAARTAAGRQGR